MKLILLLLGLFFVFIAANHKPSQEVRETGQYKETLSEYDFFEGDLKDMRHKEGVLIPYEMNTPLFSDYAFKKRYIYLPEGSKMSFKSENLIDFPVGTMLLKHFYYPQDFSKPEENYKILETRFMVLEESGWQLVNYVWNEEQTEAYLDVASHTIPINWIDAKGQKKEIEYKIPNERLCKSCHIKGKTIEILGPSVGQLNNKIGKNQLELWAEKGYLEALPKPKEELPYYAKWDDSKETLDLRAKAWLDANCAHCHNNQGIAKLSGLNLKHEEENPISRGILKKPNSKSLIQGDYQYDIEPGKPETSILVFRVENHDPDIRMPQIASQMPHYEGLEMIKEWIKEMKD